MPSLDFKGKQFVHSHHLSVPFRELVVEPKKSLPAKGAKPSLDDNLIIHGDNLEALRALMPRYAGKVDCISIDPPYNNDCDDGGVHDRLVTARILQEYGADPTALQVISIMTVEKREHPNESMCND